MNSQIILHPSTKHQVDLFLSSQNLNSIGVYGQPGSGKSYLAIHLIEHILQIPNVKVSPYVKIIDCADSVGIEEIREIKTFLRLKVPSSSRFSRCVVIERLELLGIPAQNALLKTVEEPPEGTVIIVTTSNKNSILPTIISRLQWINMLPLAQTQLNDNFFSSFDRANLQKAYLISQGNAASLISLARDPGSSPDLIAAIDEAKELLRCTRYGKLARIDSIIKNEDYALNQLLDAMAKILRSVIIKNPTQASANELIKKLDGIVQAKESLKYSPSQKLLLTALFNKL